MTSIDLLPDDAESLKRLLLAREEEPAAPAALFYYSRDRSGEHAQRYLASYSAILQADAYGGYGKLYAAGRSAGAILEAACWRAV